MTKEIWLASDHHFGDSKISDYLDYDNKTVMMMVVL